MLFQGLKFVFVCMLFSWCHEKVKILHKTLVPSWLLRNLNIKLVKLFLNVQKGRRTERESGGNCPK